MFLLTQTLSFLVQKVLMLFIVLSVILKFLLFHHHHSFFDLKPTYLQCVTKANKLILPRLEGTL